MNNPRYVRVVREGVLYFVREDVLKAHDFREHRFIMLLRLSDYVIEGNRLLKNRTCVSDMVNSYIQNSLETIVITEAQFESENESEKIKEHYLEF